MEPVPDDTLQLFTTEVRKERDIIEREGGPLAERNRSDLQGFWENFPRLRQIMAVDPNFGLFDLMQEKETYRIDIGPVYEQLEWDLFNAIRVSNEIPFVVMNLDKVKTAKATYTAEDRRFKIYHSKDITVPHDAFLNEWSTSRELNLAKTLVMKVLVKDDDSVSGLQPVNKSYVELVYIFGEGLYIEFKKKHTGKNPLKILEILRRHVVGFEIGNTRREAISSVFVVDHLRVNPALFRMILAEAHNLGGQRPLLFWPYFWTNEKGQSLALRPHFILNFQLGDIRAKITISEKEAKSNNIFYLNDEPVTFKEDESYNKITISEVNTAAQAQLIRDVIASAFYLYGQPQFEGAQVVSRSLRWEQVYNFMLGKPPGLEAVKGALFGPSFKISAEDIKQIDKNIMQLRQVDPTFYGKIPTGGPASKIERQPLFLVRSTDPNWQSILAQEVTALYNDPAGKRRQIIRYPFVIANPSSEEFARVPRTVVKPYFLISQVSAPAFKIKPNPTPLGGRNTYHPYLISASQKSTFIATPGTTPQEIYYHLVNLDAPFQIQLIEKARSERSTYVLSTPKILNLGADGAIPQQLEDVLVSIVNPGTKGSRPLFGVRFERLGSHKTADSLLHVLVTQTIHRPDDRNTYGTLSLVGQLNYLRTTLRQRIAEQTNWNVARQEGFDMEPQTMKDLFLNPETPIDSKLFKTVLERYFNVYLLVIEFDRVHFSVELPRRKFLYISQPLSQNVQPLVIFKHLKSAHKLDIPQYEYLKFFARESEDGPERLMNWEIGRLKFLFERVNASVDTSFGTVYRTNENAFQIGPIVKPDANLKPSLFEIFDRQNVLYQYVDGAGKLRAIVHAFRSDDYPGQHITLTCEPLAPLDIDAFDDPAVYQSMIHRGFRPESFLEPEDFDRALAFIQSLGPSATNIAYCLEHEELELVEDVEKPPPAKKLPPQPTRIQEQASISDIVPTPPLLAVAQAPVAKPKSTRRIVKIKKENPTAIGIWFESKGIRFYIATTPGEPEEEIFAIDNIPYFEVKPDFILFRKHDFYERVANIMIQLVRNLYLYSRQDDPEFFLTRMTVINREVVYDISTARRRLPGLRDFGNSYVGYVQLFPSFFTVPAPKSLPKLILDSNQTRKGILQHLKAVQKLKEDIFGASGSKLTIYEAKDSGYGVKKVVYETLSTFVPQSSETVAEKYRPPSTGINDEIIEYVPRMKEFYNRPDYILEFYAYASDFAVRGPDQVIFTSEQEIRQYRDLLEMETRGKLISLPVTTEMENSKNPLYLSPRDGSLYILQNVAGGTARRAYNVIAAWDNERVNLGYYADEWEGAASNLPIIDAKNLSEIDTSNYFMLVRYPSKKYAALLKLAGSVVF